MTSRDQRRGSDGTAGSPSNSPGTEPHGGGFPVTIQSPQAASSSGVVTGDGNAVASSRGVQSATTLIKPSTPPGKRKFVSEAWWDGYNTLYAFL